MTEQTEREQREKNLAHMEGLAKFHQMDIEDDKKYQEGINALHKLSDITIQSVYQEKEKDWAVLGGLAEGIAGPAAGIMTAANAISENERIKTENAARRKAGAEQSAYFTAQAIKAAMDRPVVLSEAQLKKKHNVILAWAPLTLFSYINITNIKTDIDEQTGAVLVSASWQQYDSSICVDGALRAKLYTDSGECAGCAYLVLPKKGTSSRKGELSGICASPKKSDTYTVCVEPLDLWELALDQNAASRTNDNLTDLEHRKLVFDSESKFLSELK